MRKVKVLALLLAALMVVAAFAGCADTDAIVADVENLDERVEALENLLNNQKDAIDDVKDQLGDVSDKLDNDTTAAQLEAVLKALEEQQKELQEQLKELGDKVTKVEEDNKESDENADDDAALQAAVKVYTAQLQELKITCELKKDLYIDADYEAVVKALSDGIVAVAAAEKADDAKAAFEAAKAVYDAKAIVSSKLAAYFAQVNNTITADSKALIEEIRAYIDLTEDTATVKNTAPVYVKYGATAATLTNAELLVDNLNGEKNTDGTIKKVNVVAELQKAVDAYDYITGAKGLKDGELVSTTGADVVYFATNVKNAINAIKDIKTVTYGEDLGTAKNALAAVEVDVLGNATATAINTNVFAPYVADSVMALVTNAADLTAAKNRVVELAVAAAMYETYGAHDATAGILSIFADYAALTDKTLYKNKAVYDATEVVLNKWINDYKLEAENVALIVDAKEDTTGFDSYADYLYNKHETELSVKAYTDFAAIANRIAAFSKLTTVTAANVKEYGDIAKALENWVVLQKADPEADPQTIYTREIILSEDNIDAILDAYDIDATANDEVIDLYDFSANEEVGDFFADMYDDIEAQRRAINDEIAALKKNIEKDSTKYPTIQKYIELEGTYTVSSNVWTKVDTVTVSGDVDTIGEFLEAYKAYDLASLLNLADFEAAKAAAIARIDGFKAGAANIKTLVEAVDYVALVKTSDVAYAPATDATAAEDVYYYVNLSDATAVEAANKAYTAWINSGATSALAAFVPNVDEDDEVIENEFVFAPIADTNVINALKQMNEDVAELKADAAKLVAHFELVAEVWNEIKATVDLAADANTAGVDVLDLAEALLDAGKVNNVVMATPVVVATTEAAYTVKFNGETYPLAKKATTVAADEAVGASLQELIDAGYAAYQAFLSKNANIVLKLNNDGALVLDKVSQVTDSSVETALKLIAAAELVMVKDYAMDILNQIADTEDGEELDTNKDGENDTLDSNVALYYCNWIKDVTSLNDTTGNSLWPVAQEIASKYNIWIASYTRGTEIKVWNTSVSAGSQAFRQPNYDNV